MPSPNLGAAISGWVAGPGADQTMSSREIAELTGKEHGDVRRDIQKLATDLSLNFEGKSEPSTGGRPSKMC